MVTESYLLRLIRETDWRQDMLREILDMHQPFLRVWQGPHFIAEVPPLQEEEAEGETRQTLKRLVYDFLDPLQGYGGHAFACLAALSYIPPTVKEWDISILRGRYVEKGCVGCKGEHRLAPVPEPHRPGVWDVTFRCGQRVAGPVLGWVEKLAKSTPTATPQRYLRTRFGMLFEALGVIWSGSERLYATYSVCPFDFWYLGHDFETCLAQTEGGRERCFSLATAPSSFVLRVFRKPTSGALERQGIGRAFGAGWFGFGAEIANYYGLHKPTWDRIIQVTLGKALGWDGEAVRVNLPSQYLERVGIDLNAEPDTWANPKIDPRGLTILARVKK